MPDRCKDEEIENRTQSLCLFDVVDITVLNRCSNCPGATRTPLQHRLCPRELLQPNIFRPEDSDNKICAALKRRNLIAPCWSLASSSKQLESGHHEAGTVLPDGFARRSLASSSKQHESGLHEADTVLPSGFARLSLGDSARTAGSFGRSESDPDIPSGRPELSRTPRMSHGVKRKAELEDRSVEEYLKLKPQKLFLDLERGNQFIPGCWRVPLHVVTALPSGEASSSRLFVPGFGMNTGPGLSGLAACNDGIETEGCGGLAYLDEMEI